MSNLQEKKEDYILSLDNSGQLTKMDIIEQNLNAIDFGYELCQKEYEEKLQKAISALKIEIDYPECVLINSRGDTFTFNNNLTNEGLIDFLSFHEEGLKSFL